MIGYLQGEVLDVAPDSLTVLTGGVGYEVSAAPSLLTGLTPGAPVRIWIYTHVREDAIHLFGFANPSERQLFLSLIKVNGIGPKSALQILGAAGPERLIEYINAGDAKALAGLPKVGKKTAEQIILTLRGKLVEVEAASGAKPASSRRAEIVSALVHLGFRLADVERVVERMPPDTDLESGVREGLIALTN